MKYAQHISELVGGTPLVRLNAVTAGLSATILAKVEYFNPGGSAKDRIALRMIEAAEASGELRPGGTIVEPTSGNTGVGLALVAQRKGYRCVFVCPDKVSEDKRDVLRAYGAEVVVTPTAVPPDHPDSYYSVSDRLVTEIEGAWKPNQYANVNGPASHYASTGPEIWADTDGRVTHFVAGVGTGGTITGTGRYLHDASADRAAADGGPVRVVGIDPMTRRLAREEALLVGGSCGMAVEGALRLARRLEDEDPAAAARAIIVVLLPDSGKGYLSKIFNDRWMRSYGFLDTEAGATVADVLRTKDGSVPALVHTHPNETVRDAIEILQEYGVSQMPVVGAEPPVKIGEVAGSVSERELLDAVFSGSASLSDRVDRHMAAALPLIGSGESVQSAREALQKHDALMVVDDGQPVGVLTRHDLLAFLAR